MQSANNMKLTDKQKASINQMDAEMATETLHECAERLGLVSVDEYSQIMCMKKRTIYDHIEKKLIKSIEFCESKLIIINN